MEMEQISQPGPGLCGSDRDVFDRVWRRVMRTGGAESPIEVIPREEYIPPAPLPVRAEVRIADQPPVPVPVPRQAEMSAVRCLGPSSAGHGEELQRFIETELTDAKTYAELARRTRGQAARTFTTMAADEKRHAKRLSTAYFLISGVRYFPAERVAPQLEGAYLSTLRNRFLKEQQGEGAYRAAAEGTQDPCLRELYLEIAGDENSHGWLLRGLLETM